MSPLERTPLSRLNRPKSPNVPALASLQVQMPIHGYGDFSGFFWFEL
jgi:hypothetical protein